ncbi:MAG: serine/threonine-protein phosphatase [Treponema sp.]|nr:serine/threonine-protein phosphatase [Treponema sp.]
MKFGVLRKKQKVLSAHDRATMVAFFACFFAFLYHAAAFVTFGILKIYPLFISNIFSVSLFLGLCILIPKAKSYVLMYTMASIEVIYHQIMAEYLLGSYTCFHYFVFLLGLLPFLVFEDDFKYSIPFTIITTAIFLVLCGINFKSRFILSPDILFAFRMVNTFVGFLMIVIVLFVYIIVVYYFERELKSHNDNLENEIRLAAFIQQNFYRHDNLKFDGWDLAYYSRPLAGVSGDLYDFYETKKGTEGLGIFDVSGHGISSGLVTMLVKNIIQQEFSLQEDNELWEIVNTINERVIAEKGKIQNYMTGILIRINKNTLELVNAGHPYPIVYRKNPGKCTVLERASEFAGGTIGIAGFPTFFYSQFVDFSEGDEIILFTDGISDIADSDGKRFIATKLPEIIEENSNLPSGDQVKLITRALKEFQEGKEITDDMTVIILKRR